MTTGSGGYLYAINADGKRIACPHPMEEYKIKDVTGLGWSEARSKGLIGFISNCICTHCLHQFELDVDRDIKCCPKCNSLHVLTVRGSVSTICPKCQIGSIVEDCFAIS